MHVKAGTYRIRGKAKIFELSSIARGTSVGINLKYFTRPDGFARAMETVLKLG